MAEDWVQLYIRTYLYLVHCERRTALRDRHQQLRLCPVSQRRPMHRPSGRISMCLSNRIRRRHVFTSRVRQRPITVSQWRLVLRGGPSASLPLSSGLHGSRLPNKSMSRGHVWERGNLRERDLHMSTW